jgi:vacuolar-type H+-ATPase subunit D/Vma8
MSTYDQSIIATAEKLLQLLHQQQQLLLHSQWPRFSQLKEQSDNLLQGMMASQNNLDQLPPQIRQQLKQAYQRLHRILSTQRHQTGEQLKQIRQHKPAVKAYRNWNQTKRSNNNISILRG